MSYRVLIVDYNQQRRQHLSQLIKTRFNDYDVDEIATHDPRVPNAPQDLDVAKLAKVKERPYDLMIGHLGGNPSGHACLQVYKNNNPKGKAVLYTKKTEVPLKILNRLKLADEVFKRSDDDNKLFDDAEEMMDIIEKVMNAPSVSYWKNPFSDPKVIGSIVALLTAILGLVAALIKFGG